MVKLMTSIAMAAHSNHGGTVAGTAGGTLLTIFANIHSEDIVKTAVLACIGAVVSFTISIGLKWITRKMQRKSSD
jgi:mannitol-specific phosphotransferase system IIBC component